MAVEVYRTYVVNSVMKHDEGEAIDVVEGHLHVRRAPSSTSKGKAIAIYAPGAWQDAKVIQRDDD